MSDLIDRLSRAVTRGLEANVRHTLEFLGEGTTELQCLGYPSKYEQSKFAHPTSLDEAVELVKMMDNAHPVGTYIIGNSPDAAVTTRMTRDTWHPAPKGSSTKDGDIKARRVLFIDVDAKRVTGTSATDEELSCAVATGVKVFDFLATLVGEQSLAFGHSGNGVSVLVALDHIPESKDVHALVAGVVHAVALRFCAEPGVEIDTSVTDAKRLMPVFGTWKRKGAPLIRERPHRRTGVVVPDPRDLRRVSLGGLKTMFATLYEETTDEGRAKLDLEMGKITGRRPAAKPAPVVAQHAKAPRGEARKAQEKGDDGPDVFALAKAVPIADVLSWLGLLDGDQPTCPGCGLSDQGVAIVKGGLKCSHNRCADKGHSAGFRTTVDVVQEHKGLAKSIDAVRELGERFGFDVPAPKKRARSTGSKEGGAREGEPDWYAFVSRNARGEIRATIGNAVAVLANDEAWRSVLVWDELAQSIKATKPPPWDALDCAKPEAGPWTDVDTIRLTAWLGRHHGLHVGLEAAYAAVELEARKRSVDPVREYFGSLAWDGTRRIDTWLSKYLRCDDSKYTQLCARFFLLAATARAHMPGCKVDTMLVLEGTQGKRKSSAVKALFGSQWFTDTAPDMQSKDRFLTMRGKWCIEWGELGGMGKADLDKLKAFLSSAVDDYRAPYARSVTSIPRRSVFFGTVNPDGVGYLRDSTGNRRFWPVATDESDHEIDIVSLIGVRDQLWAEALEVLRSDPAVLGRDWADVDTNQLTVGRWWPKGDELALFRDSQEERLTADAWADPIASYLRKPTTSDTWVTVADVLADALNIDKGKWTQADQSRAAKCMTLLGWRRSQRRDRGVRAWGYVPPTDWQRSTLQLVPSPL